MTASRMQVDLTTSTVSTFLRPTNRHSSRPCSQVTSRRKKPQQRLRDHVRPPSSPDLFRRLAAHPVTPTQGAAHTPFRRVTHFLCLRDACASPRIVGLAWVCALEPNICVCGRRGKEVFVCLAASLSCMHTEYTCVCGFQLSINDITNVRKMQTSFGRLDLA